jgi:hypothetical protein
MDGPQVLVGRWMILSLNLELIQTGQSSLQGVSKATFNSGTKSMAMGRLADQATEME